MNHFISLEQAIQMTTAFRENKDKILAPDFQGSDVLANAETFDRAAFDQVLAQPGCQKLRIYYGMDAELKVHAIIVGVDAENRDLLRLVADQASTTEGSNQPGSMDATTGDDTGDPLIVEVGQRCPPDCAEDSPLNP